MSYRVHPEVYSSNNNYYGKSYIDQSQNWNYYSQPRPLRAYYQAPPPITYERRRTKKLKDEAFCWVLILCIICPVLGILPFLMDECYHYVDD